jgi:hypothetical protein
MTTARDFTHRLAGLLRREHAAMADFLVALADFDRRRLWLELGHASLFYFLHRELGLSKGAAFYRKTAAELVQRFPEIVEPLRDGRICITSVVHLATVLTPENREEMLPRFFHRSRREALEIAAAIRPAAAAPRRDMVTAYRAAAAGAITEMATSSAPQVVPAVHLAALRVDPACEAVHAAEPAADLAHALVQRAGLAADRAHIAVHPAEPMVDLAHAVVQRAGLAVDTAHIAVHPAEPTVDLAHAVVQRAGVAADRAHIAVHPAEPAALLAHHVVRCTELTVDTAHIAVHPAEPATDRAHVSGERAEPPLAPARPRSTPLAAGAPPPVPSPPRHRLPPPLPAPRDTAEPVTAELSRLHVTVSRRFLAKLEAARAALSHTRPGASAEEILEAGLDLVLAERARRKGLVAKPRKEPPPSRSDRLPAHVRRTVWTRDGGRFQWPTHGGGICGSTLRVEVDHVVPRARGGPPTVENCRLLCRAPEISPVSRNESPARSTR